MREAAKPFHLEKLPTVEEALKRFIGALPAYRPPEEQVPLEEAVGRVLARAVRAGADVPGFARSLVDGYAVRAADTVRADEGGGPPVLRVAGRVQMGRAPDVNVGPGEAAWIPTGGMLPPGADAVVPVEHTEVRGTTPGRPTPTAIAVTVPVRPGENVLPAAADLAAGEVLLDAGHRLRPQDVGALAAVGCVRPWVYRRPVVAIFSTGDELVPPDREPGAGQVRDANAYSLAAAVRADGGIPRIGGIVADDAAAWRAALQEGLRHDLVLLSGGSSVGLDDLAADIIRELGSPGILVHGVRMAPGKPTLLALIGDRVVCGLPGNPVSALVTYELFVRPALRWRMGCAALQRWQPVVRARLAADIRAPKGRELYARVRLDVVAGELVAEPLRGGSAQLTSLVRADGLVVVPLERGWLPAGEPVEVRLFS
ncbi:MAG TPA: gephyrin-like molybdotransferase Glp [Limnochordales bacterium]